MLRLHASDFSKVDCRYQSGDGKKSGDVMFQELIDKAHEKGIKEPRDYDGRPRP